MRAVDRAWRGGRNDWRLHVLSIFSVAVAFVCLGAALLVLVNVDGMRERWARTGRASVYLRADAKPADVAALEQALRATEGVTDVSHVSSERARHEIAGSGDAVLARLPAEAFPASLEVAIAGSVDAAALAGRLAHLPAVETVETYDAWTERLGRLLAGAVTASALLALVVLGAVASVVASTIRLFLQRRRIEVEVAKLVGATDSWVRRPFVIEGAAQGAGGAAIAVLLLGALFAIVRGHFDGAIATLVGATPAFLPWPAVGAIIALGGLLGAAAAWASLRRLLVV
jgi:cell division transport system permease protein